MRYYDSIIDLIGGTPLLKLNRYAARHQLPAKLFAKLELLNPAGSVKDRVALSMLDDAEARGLLRPGTVIIEPTSGNTGIGLAAVAAARGYRVILTMPETMSVERRKLLAAYGAELVLTPGAQGMAGAIAEAEALAARIPGSLLAGQFVNPANPEAHRRSTGPEIWADTDGTVDVFVAGAGTGGTVTGVGEYLKSKNGALRREAGQARSAGHRRGVRAPGVEHRDPGRDPAGHRRGRLRDRPGAGQDRGPSGGHHRRRGGLGRGTAGSPAGKPGQDHCGPAAGPGRAVSVHPDV